MGIDSRADICYNASFKQKKVEVVDNSSIQDILRKLSINLDTCLTLIENKPAPIDSILKDGQTVKLIEVISGG